MKWSWKIGRAAGIDVYVHATFVLLLGWVALRYWLAEQSVAAVLAGVGFIIALFACVVLHEFGHAITARKYGIRTRDITLLPIGGVARLERMPDDPRQELWVALAGPAVNFVIAAVLFGWLRLAAGPQSLADLSVTGGGFFDRLMVINVFLAAFNLLPAFPMDGGRVLRAVLAMRMEYTRATQVAAQIGQGMALLFGFAGLLGNPFLLFIALFVWIGAAQEASIVQMKAALGGIPVRQAMITEFRTLAPADVLDHAVALLLSGEQKVFPVVDGDQVVGVLTHTDLLAAVTNRGREVPIADVMRPTVETIDSHDMLESAVVRLQSCGCQALPVTHNGRLVGLVTLDNIGEFVSLQTALRRPAPRPGRHAA